MSALKPCPHCGGELKEATYSEDGATVTVISCSSEACKPTPWHARQLDSLYIGETDWQYGRERANKRTKEFDQKWQDGWDGDTDIPYASEIVKREP